MNTPIVLSSAQIEEQYKALVSKYAFKSGELLWNDTYPQWVSLYDQITHLTTLDNCPDWIKEEVFFIKRPNIFTWCFDEILSVTVVNPKTIDMRRDKNGL